MSYDMYFDTLGDWLNFEVPVMFWLIKLSDFASKVLLLHLKGSFV